MRFNINRILFFTVFVSTLFTQHEVTISNSSSYTIISSKNNREYFIKVKVPRNYDFKKKYPVIYVIDAESNFGATSYIVQRLIKDDIIPEIIVVGIAYDTSYKEFYRLRGLDLTADKGVGRMARFPSGKALDFIEFIEKDLMPSVESKYSINKNDKAIYGHSLGGLFTFQLLFKKTNMFNRYISLSPSLWWSCKKIFDEIDSIQDISGSTRFYVATGELENAQHHCNKQSMVDHQIEMVDILNSKHIKKFLIESEILKNETHRTIFGRGFTNGLRFIYSK